ncbi:MAG: nucleotidyltransferase domain-containing protein [Bacillota bacterium]|jgi:predicted nucleotidyltransferase
MINIKEWLPQYKKLMLQEFGSRIIFMGLQGSYARNEASENSDIDLVLILDTLTFDDLKKYKYLINKLPYSELICGFISGKAELANWNTPELFQFYHDTLPIIGHLDNIIPEISQDTVKQAIHNEACNIYHGCCHNFLYETDIDILKQLYKKVISILKAKCFENNQIYCKTQNELVRCIKNGLDKSLLITAIHRDSINEKNFELHSESLIAWSAKLISDYQQS